MRESNEKLKLNEVCEAIIDCEHKTAPRSETGYPSIRTPNIGRGFFLLEGVYRVNQETYEKWTQRGTPEPGDLILAREAPVGNVAIIPKGLQPCLGQRTVLIKPNRTRVDPHYLTYLLLGDEVQGHIHSQTNGATVAHLNMKDIRALPLPSLPDLPTQRKIAGILSAYDDLIENNLRRIRILEEMAQSLYREWFVHFRFPGHESTPMVDSPLGPIPEGWDVASVGDLVQFKSGFAFKSGSFTADGENRLVTIKNVQDGSFNPEAASLISELPANLPTYCILEDGDILMSLTGNVGRVCLVFDGLFLLNQRVCKLLPVEAFDWAVAYCMFRDPEMRVKLERLSTGVAQQNLSPVLASKMDALLPPYKLRQGFGNLAEPIVRRIVHLYNSNQTLRQTRDLLLPKLLSGQMRLDIGESDFEESRVRRVARSARPSNPALVRFAKPAVSTTKPAPPKTTRPATATAENPPLPIDEIQRAEVLCAIRKLFNDGGSRDRETTLKDLSAALGYGRLGSHIREVLSTDLLTAVRRGILASEGGEYTLGFRSIADLPRDTLKDTFLSAIGRAWIPRDEAIRSFARHLGFARTGETLEHTGRSLINGLIREGRLETGGDGGIRKV